MSTGVSRSNAQSEIDFDLAFYQFDFNTGDPVVFRSLLNSQLGSQVNNTAIFVVGVDGGVVTKASFQRSSLLLPRQDVSRNNITDRFRNADLTRYFYGSGDAVSGSCQSFVLDGLPNFKFVGLSHILNPISVVTPETLDSPTIGDPLQGRFFFQSSPWIHYNYYEYSSIDVASVSQDVVDWFQSQIGQSYTSISVNYSKGLSRPELTFIGAGGGGVDRYVDLTDVSVPAPVDGAITHYNAGTAKFEQVVEVKVDPTTRDITSNTSGAVSIVGAGDVGVSSSVGNVNVDGNEINLTGSDNLTAEGSGAVLRGNTLPVYVQALNDGVIVEGQNVLVRGNVDDVTLNGKAFSSVQVDGVNKFNADSITTRVEGDYVDIDTNNSVAGVISLRPSADPLSRVAISTTNKSAAQYALDITGNDSYVPNVKYVDDAVAGVDLSTKVTKGGDVGAPLEIGTNDLQPLQLRTNATPAVTIETSGKVSSNILNYETLVTTGDVFTNKQYVDDAVAGVDLSTKVTKGGDVGTLIIGTNDPQPLQLRTNATPAVTLEPTGKMRSNILNYETLVTAGDVFTNKQYVDDAVSGAVGATTLPALADVTITAPTEYTYLKANPAGGPTDQYVESLTRLAPLPFQTTPETGTTYTDDNKKANVTYDGIDYYYPLTTKAEPAVTTYPAAIDALGPRAWWKNADAQSSIPTNMVWPDSVSGFPITAQVPSNSLSFNLPYPPGAPTGVPFANSTNGAFFRMKCNTQPSVTDHTIIIFSAVMANPSADANDPEQYLALYKDGVRNYTLLATSPSPNAEIMAVRNSAGVYSNIPDPFSTFCGQSPGSAANECSIIIRIKGATNEIQLQMIGQYGDIPNPTSFIYPSPTTYYTNNVPFDFNEIQMGDQTPTKRSQFGTAEMIDFPSLLSDGEVLTTLNAWRESLQIDPTPLGYTLRELSVVNPSLSEVIRYDGSKFENKQLTRNDLTDGATFVTKGGDADGATLVVGTTDAQDLDLIRNGVPVLQTTSGLTSLSGPQTLITAAVGNVTLVADSGSIINNSGTFDVSAGQSTQTITTGNYLLQHTGAGAIEIRTDGGTGDIGIIAGPNEIVVNGTNVVVEGTTTTVTSGVGPLTLNATQVECSPTYTAPTSLSVITRGILNDIFNARSVAVFDYEGNTALTALTLNVPTPFVAPNVTVNESVDRTNEWSANLIGTPGGVGSTIRYTFARPGAVGVLFRISFAAEWRSDANDKEIAFQVRLNGAVIGITLTGNAHPDKAIIAGFSGVGPLSDADYLEIWATNIEDNSGLLVPAFSITFEEIILGA